MLVQKRAVCQSMLDRIVMNVIDMPIHVILISNYTIPESSLPSAPARQIMSFAIPGSERQFNSMQYSREIVFARVYQYMKVIRQENVGNQIEVCLLFCGVECLPQQIVICPKERLAVIGDIRHEINLVGGIVSLKNRHDII